MMRAAEDDEYEVCPTCEGARVIVVWKGFGMEPEECPTCGGEGIVKAPTDV